MGAVRQPTPQRIVFKVLRDFLRDHDFTDQEKKVYTLFIREIPSADSLFQDSLVPLVNIYTINWHGISIPCKRFLLHSAFCLIVIPRISSSAKKISGLITLSGGNTPLASMSPRAIICAPMPNGMAIFL